MGNIVLFIPIGVLLPIVIENIKWQWVVLVGFGFSLFIEIVQLITGFGCFDLDDILLNTIGTTIGFGLWKVVVNKKTS